MLFLYIIGYIVLCVTTALVLVRMDWICTDDYGLDDYLFIGMFSIMFSVLLPVLLPVLLIGFIGKNLSDVIRNKMEKR
jgi:hypothetical protein